MIPAKKDPFRDSILYAYLRWMLRRNFHAIRIAGLHHLQSLEKTRPTIAFANHTNWWDGLLVFFLTRFQRGKDFYCMMEEKQMKHYRFFAWMGAFSVDLENSIRAAATVRYTCELLRTNRTLIWIFPQGKMVSPYEPITIRPGVDFMAKRFKNAQMMPMALYFDFEREQKPFAYMRIGQPFLAIDSSEERLAEEMEALRKQIQEDVGRRDFKDYECIQKPSLSVNKRWEWIRRAFTGRLAGYERDN